MLSCDAHYQPQEIAVLLDRSLFLSFRVVHDEMDNLWNEVESIKDWMSTSPPDCSGSSPLFQGRQVSSTLPQSPSLTPPALQVLMSKVVDKLRLLGFVTWDEKEAHVSRGLDFNFADQLSGLGRRVAALERKFTEPDGTLTKIDARISSLEDWRAGDSIERGHKAFRDIGAVAAWVQTFEDKDLYRNCRHGGVDHAVC